MLLLIAPDEERLDRMEGQARLVVEAREDVRIERAAVARGESAVIAEALRRLGGGFVICQFGGLVVPDEGDLGRWPRCSSVRCCWCGSATTSGEAALKIIANLLVAVVALLHVGFLVLEMFLWTTPFGLKTFNMTPRGRGFLGRACRQPGALQRLPGGRARLGPRSPRRTALRSRSSFSAA